MGTPTIALRALIEKKEVILGGESILALLITAEPSDDKADGMFNAMTPRRDATNLSTDLSLPASKNAVAYRLERLAVRLNPDDVAARSGGAKRQVGVSLEIVQGTRTVYKSVPIKDGKNVGEWTPPASFLYLEPNESVRLKVTDDDAVQPLIVINKLFSPEDIGKGILGEKTPKGSFLRVALAPLRPRAVTTDSKPAPSAKPANKKKN